MSEFLVTLWFLVRLKIARNWMSKAETIHACKLLLVDGH